MIGVASLVAVLLLGLVITRVATVALRTTGLSQEAARFQARSAFSGVGFTTSESEDIVNHPARRRIVLGLMLLSSAGVVTTIASLLLSFAGTSGYRQPALRVLAVILALLLVWRISASSWVDAKLSALAERGLRRWTDLEVRDYVRLLALHDSYSVAEITIGPDDWLEGRTIGDLDLREEGIVVLGIRRADGRYVGAPTAASELAADDTLILYGRAASLQELERRRAGAAGDASHERAMTEQRQILADEVEEERRRACRRSHRS